MQRHSSCFGIHVKFDCSYFLSLIQPDQIKPSTWGCIRKIRNVRNNNIIIMKNAKFNDKNNFNYFYDLQKSKRKLHILYLKYYYKQNSKPVYPKSNTFFFKSWIYNSNSLKHSLDFTLHSSLTEITLIIVNL